MRILQVNLEDQGGAFSLVYQIQKVLKDKVTFDYYSMDSFRNKEIINSIYQMGGNVIEANLRKNRLFGHMKLPICFYHFLKNNEYDVLHIHADTAWKLLIYAIPAKVVGIKRIIIHAHSSDVNGNYRAVKIFCHKIAKLVLPKFADVYCTCSDLASQWMYLKRIQKRVVFIKNGIDTEKFRFDGQARNTIRKRLNISDDICVIGMVGNLSYQKNPEYALQIFKNLYKRNKQIILMFVGDGSDRTTIEAQVKNEKYYNNIIFYGYTTEVNKILNAFDVFILPSRFEGLPVCAIEAQTNGLPCILSDVISRQSKLSDNCSFMKITEDPSNWAERISNYFYIKTCRDNAYKRVIEKGFDIKKTAEIIYMIYVN